MSQVHQASRHENRYLNTEAEPNGHLGKGLLPVSSAASPFSRGGGGGKKNGQRRNGGKKKKKINNRRNQVPLPSPTSRVVTPTTSASGSMVAGGIPRPSADTKYQVRDEWNGGKMTQCLLKGKFINTEIKYF